MGSYPSVVLNNLNNSAKDASRRSVRYAVHLAMSSSTSSRGGDHTLSSSFSLRSVCNNFSECSTASSTSDHALRISMSAVDGEFRRQRQASPYIAEFIGDGGLGKEGGLTLKDICKSSIFAYTRV